MNASELGAAIEHLPGLWRDVVPGWTLALRERIVRCVAQVSSERPIAPDDPFRALRLVAPGDVKVVVFGQDPYPTAGHADGLAFSAGRGRPRSLARIFEVLAQDRPGFVPPADGRLDDWARRGVLLLNPTLTVEIGAAGSHLRCGWQELTAQIVQVLCQRVPPPVFLLWGSKAATFFEAAKPPGAAPRTLTTRHPSYDIERRFMCDASHFVATQDEVDWWALAHSGA